MQQVLDLLAYDDDVFQQCLSVQPAPTALQRSNRGKCARLLRDLAATADLPPHRALFTRQLLDLTHRWWSEAEGPDIDVGDVYPLAAAAYICNNLHSAMYRDRPHFSFQIPSSQPASSLAAILGRRQPRNVPPLLSAQAVHEVVDEEYHILRFSELRVGDLLAGRLGASLRGSLLPEGPASLLPYSHCSWCSGERRPVHRHDFVRDHPFSLESTPSRIGSSAWFLSCMV